MAIIWMQLIGMLIVIFLASQLFTNALEHFSEKIKISEGATGSIFAAVATALPETLVPIIAIVAGTANQNINEEISVGAILGAPLMLSTLSTGIMAISVSKARGLTGTIKPEKSGFIRDLNFFIIAFSLGASALYVPSHPLYFRSVISFLLVLLYIIYAVITFQASSKLVEGGHGTVSDGPLTFTHLKLPNTTSIILLQLIVGIVLLLSGAKGFISAIEHISFKLNISALLLSLLIIPIATELPEKVNSIIWVRKNKDTLGFGNITGAMVFQGSLLPALGILLTPWMPTSEVVNGIFITLIAAAWLRLNARKSGIPIYVFLINAVLYLLYLFLTCNRLVTIL